MARITTQDHLAVKTPEAAFLHVLQEEFRFSPRVSRELLSTAQEMLVGSTPASAVRPGQVRLVVASLKAPFGPPLSETDQGSTDGETDKRIVAVQAAMREGLRALWIDTDWQD